jgi:hypothetical protein
MKKFYTTVATTAVLLSSSFLTQTANSADLNYSGIYYLGDSLSDPGNLYTVRPV